MKTVGLRRVVKSNIIFPLSDCKEKNKEIFLNNQPLLLRKQKADGTSGGLIIKTVRNPVREGSLIQFIHS